MGDFIIFLLNPAGAIAWAFGCLLILIGLLTVIETLAQITGGKTDDHTD